MWSYLCTIFVSIWAECKIDENKQTYVHTQAYKIEQQGGLATTSITMKFKITECNSCNSNSDCEQLTMKIQKRFWSWLILLIMIKNNNLTAPFEINTIFAMKMPTTHCKLVICTQGEWAGKCLNASRCCMKGKRGNTARYMVSCDIAGCHCR